MKRFNIGFLPIIAMLTIGLTAATKVDTGKKAAKKSTYTCVEGVDFMKGDFKKTDGTVVGIRYNDALTTGTNNACPSEGIFCAKDDANLVILTVPGEPDTYECTTGTNEFCCAKLLPNASPCATSPHFTQYTKRVQIYCRP